MSEEHNSEHEKEQIWLELFVDGIIAKSLQVRNRPADVSATHRLAMNVSTKKEIKKKRERGQEKVEKKVLQCFHNGGR